MRALNGLSVGATILMTASIVTVAQAKTASECVAEWRADKAGMQARGTTQKAYVDQCRAGTAATATPPAPAPVAPKTTAAPTPQKPAPTATAPTPQPTRAPTSNATLEAGQYAQEFQAKAHCPTDTVVWANLSSKIYHFSGGKSYGTTKRGAYMCEKEATTAEFRAAKNEKHP